MPAGILAKTALMTILVLGNGPIPTNSNNAVVIAHPTCQPQYMPQYPIDLPIAQQVHQYQNLQKRLDLHRQQTLEKKNPPSLLGAALKKVVIIVEKYIN